MDKPKLTGSLNSGVTTSKAQSDLITATMLFEKLLAPVLLLLVTFGLSNCLATRIQTKAFEDRSLYERALARLESGESRALALEGLLRKEKAFISAREKYGGYSPWRETLNAAKDDLNIIQARGTGLIDEQVLDNAIEPARTSINAYYSCLEENYPDDSQTNQDAPCTAGFSLEPITVLSSLFSERIITFTIYDLEPWRRDVLKQEKRRP
ncbi:MAG: hypothetical protein H6739_34510 [Alphaproteobacteria bacterium]|nr:hypothetical protein [Alphaproteobacteria bacterium]